MWITWDKASKTVLQGLIQGDTLKSHRNLEGQKVYKLHPLTGEPQTVSRRTVFWLKKRGLIVSNQKFPAATYVLTEKGKALALKLTPNPNHLNPVSANRSR
jgi:hypothetical protein